MGIRVFRLTVGTDRYAPLAFEWAILSNKGELWFDGGHLTQTEAFDAGRERLAELKGDDDRGEL
jgi:hypothetical protein